MSEFPRLLSVWNIGFDPNETNPPSCQALFCPASKKKSYSRSYYQFLSDLASVGSVMVRGDCQKLKV